MLKLENDLPHNCEGCLKKEIRVYDFLDKEGIEYQRIDHEAVNNIEVCVKIDRALNATICKNLFLCNRQKTNFYLLMLKENKKLCTKELSKQLGVARLSFADETFME